MKGDWDLLSLKVLRMFQGGKPSGIDRGRSLMIGNKVEEKKHMNNLFALGDEDLFCEEEKWKKAVVCCRLTCFILGILFVDI